MAEHSSQEKEGAKAEMGGLAGLGAGVLAGAQVGTMLLGPVVGTFAGALVGGVLGSRVGRQLASDDDKSPSAPRPESAASEAAPVPEVAPDTAGESGGAAGDITSRLEKLSRLRADGMLTDEEFRAAKAKLLR